VFVLAVIVPSLVLAWLAVRSLRDQQFLLERQQSLLHQGLADAKARQIQAKLLEQQHQFSEKVIAFLGGHEAGESTRSFDRLLRQEWPLAEVGFVVAMNGEILSPSPTDRPAARLFCADYSLFLANREVVEVYASVKDFGKGAPSATSKPVSSAEVEANAISEKQLADAKFQQPRKVIPQQSLDYGKVVSQKDPLLATSKFSAAEAEFRQLIGDDTEGTVARFVNNKLSLLMWHRPARDGQLIFGAQLAIPRLVQELAPIVAELEPAFREGICVALLDDAARPVAVSRPDFQTEWKRPFVATEIGEVLPHWELAVYLLDPARLTRSARSITLTLGLLVVVLLCAIGVGSWLIVADVRRQLTLARQKTDFVSNVSHELKTPLTSIRMFTELLSEGRVVDGAKQQSYLRIIGAETARLTRLINNVLDFARLERGETRYRFQKSDLAQVARETAEGYRPQLQANGFVLHCELSPEPVYVNADRDALAQVIVNLLSNAEKYSGERKEIELAIQKRDGAAPSVEVQVFDRGLGVPAGCEEKIFEQFYRAHDSLSSGIQGSGLGLTLARQIARAHGGDVVYAPREGGGSCFCLRLPRSA
jgi:signal transduction histidine kinase